MGSKVKVIYENLVGAISPWQLHGSSSNLTWLLTMKGIIIIIIIIIIIYLLIKRLIPTFQSAVQHLKDNYKVTSKSTILKVNSIIIVRVA